MWSLRKDEIGRTGGEEAKNAAVVAGSSKCCWSCGSAFNFLFRKRVECTRCRRSVCRDCLVRRAEEGGINVCRPCEKIRLLQVNFFAPGNHCGSAEEASAEFQAETDSGYDASQSTEGSLKRPLPLVFSPTNCRYSDLESRPTLPLTDFGKSIEEEGEIVLDPRAQEIREHIESLIEKIIHDNLDAADLHRLYSHPECVAIRLQRVCLIVHSFRAVQEHSSSSLLHLQFGVGVGGGGFYDRMFDTYQGRLSEALTQLGLSLHMAIANQPVQETPTCAHVRLKQIVDEALQEAMGLPFMESPTSDARSIPSPTLSPMENELDDYLHSQSYEDILATAILNKVIDKYQKKNYPESVIFTRDLSTPTRELSSKEIQTEDEMENSQYSTYVSRGTQSDGNEDGSESEAGSESAGEDFTWKDNAPNTLSYTLEERIEEITTTIEDTESEAESRHPVPAPRQRVHHPLLTETTVTAFPSLGCLPAELDFSDQKKVPFPELGLDVVDLGSGNMNETVNKDVSLLVSAVDNWEENWRFRKKAFAYGKIGGMRNVMCDMPVPMLIPNPEDVVKTRIGSRDVDELSDLSEKISEGSLDLSASDTESESGLARDLSPIDYEPELQILQKDRESSESYLKNETVNGGRSVNLSSPDEFRRKQTPSPRPVPMPRRNKNSLPSSPQLDRSHLPSSTSSFPKFVPPLARDRTPMDLYFVSPPKSKVVHSGRAARFDSRVFSKEPFDVFWFCGLELLQDGGRFVIYQDDDDFHLVIYDTVESDESTYSCLVHSEAGEAWADFRLGIRGRIHQPGIPEFVQQLDDAYVIPRNNVTFTCKVVGFPEPHVKWYCDGQQLRPGRDAKIECGASGEWRLEMMCTNSFEMEVMAVAINRLGQSTSSAYVRIGSSPKHQLRQLTQKVNSTQDKVHEEAENMLTSASQLSFLSNQLDAIDETISRLEIGFQERTWEERRAGLQRDALHLERCENTVSAALRHVTGEALDIVVAADEMAKERRSSMTIAEREHNKWLSPAASATIPNNPYTSEKLTKRALTERNGVAAMTRKKSWPMLTKDDIVLSEKEDAKMTRPKNLSRYRRDYFVHENGENVDVPEKVVPEIKLDALEEKMYVTAGKMVSLEEKICNLESQVELVLEDTPARHVSDLEDRVAHAAAQVTQNVNQISIVESQVSWLQRSAAEKQEYNRQQSRIRRSHSDRTNLRWPPRCNSSQQLSFLAPPAGDSFLSMTRAVSMEDLNPVTRKTSGATTLNRRPLARRTSSSVSCLYRPTTDSDTSVSSVNVRDEVPDLPSVRDLVIRYQEGIDQGGSQPSTLERKRPVISVVNIQTQDSQHSNPVYEARNVIIIEKSSPSPQPRVQSVESSSELRVDRTAPPNVRELTRKYSSGPNAADITMDVNYVQRVHSLTARSLSKEFREAIQRQIPRKLSRHAVTVNVMDGSESSGLSGISSPDATNPLTTTLLSPGNDSFAWPDTDVHGYTSDESSAGTQSGSAKDEETEVGPAFVTLWRKRL